MRGWKTGLIMLGIVFPLMGATLIVVWLGDRVLFGRASRRERVTPYESVER
jgi:uncharacterized iron-regulated membrane protein